MKKATTTYHVGAEVTVWSRSWRIISKLERCSSEHNLLKILCEHPEIPLSSHYWSRMKKIAQEVKRKIHCITYRPISLPTNQPSNQLPNQPMDHPADLLGCLHEIKILKYSALLDSDSDLSIMIKFHLSKPCTLIFEPKSLENCASEMLTSLLCCIFLRR